MGTRRLDELTDINDLIGMVLTEEEKKKVTFADIVELLERIEGDSIGAGYIAERLFGRVKWGEQAFYD